jgi:hypothetical protein
MQFEEEARSNMSILRGLTTTKCAPHAALALRGVRRPMERNGKPLRSAPSLRVRLVQRFLYLRIYML